MQVRKAVEKDFPAVYFMGHETWGQGLTIDEYSKKCSESDKYDNGQWYVLEVDKKIVSSLICYRNSFGLDAHTVGIGSVATLPEYRKRGYVSFLMHDIVSNQDHGKDARAFLLFSDIKPEFYEKFGFKILPSHLQRYKKSITMVRDMDNHFNLHEMKLEDLPVYF
ncbi:GNAT family N-acetyltransferase [Fluviispira vulneris]|uniref:GNAT family N-acetyltransferase n=1 Tax=Fluviispira vulneris TaxID=2763012 RepID=UPI00164631A6|nr:GNAT family N-acetyltransferase [Fluviispira vulneris]